jgi:hypothetical protein
MEIENKIFAGSDLLLNRINPPTSKAIIEVGI